jgi:hypothetical protein
MNPFQMNPMQMVCSTCRIISGQDLVIMIEILNADECVSYPPLQNKLR